MAQSNYNTEVLADSPVAFYKLDEASGLPQDSSGNANHMTTSHNTGNMTYQSAGPFSGAFSILFAYLASPGTYFERALLLNQSDNFTLECWMKPIGIAAVTEPLAIHNGSSLFDGYGLAARYDNGKSAGTLSVWLGTSWLLSGPIISINNWIHAAVIRRSGTWELYLNGELWNNSQTGAPAAPTSISSIGVTFDTGSQLYVSNVSFYSTALSSARINAHYKAGLDLVSKVYNLKSSLALA